MRLLRHSIYRRLFVYTFLSGSLIIIGMIIGRSNSNIEKISSEQSNIRLCLNWQSADRNEAEVQHCLVNDQLLSTIWTHNGTGIMKYIQWIVTRKLSNVRISRVNNDCRIIKETYFSPDKKNEAFVQIYIVSLALTFEKESLCSQDLLQNIEVASKLSQQIYFQRKSLNATLTYEHLDAMDYLHNGTFDWNISSRTLIENAKISTEYLIKNLKKISKSKLLIINSEDLIYSNLLDCEKAMKDFFSLLRINTSTQIFRDVLEYDSHEFIKDATWWDQSETIELILEKGLQINSGNFTYSKDFYHLHGNNSFAQYISHNRQCFRDGIFPQMHHETITNRLSTDKPERCSLKPFDCSFSDLYSFNDREQLYQSYPIDNYFNQNTIKCGFAVQSILNTVRNRYGRNDTCQTVVFTCITNCYDPLPTVQDALPPDICFVALVDTKTKNAFEKHYPNGQKPGNAGFPWVFIDLGESSKLFRVPAKVTETLKIVGHRMFPLAKWFIWLDGKAFIINIKEVLTYTMTSVTGLHHSDFNRTSENEVSLTITRVKVGEIENSLTLNTTLKEIELQEKEYKRDGFYSRSNEKGLPLFDIAIFTYRNHHPCVHRYLCGWHNEINYFSYRGQLSVYYAAERFNLTRYLGFIPRRLYHTMGHVNVC